MPTVDDFDLDGLDDVDPMGAAQYYHAPFYNDLVGCTACPIRGEARQVVPGDGPAEADILFLGQNPGDDEDKDGRPFCGRAGKELNKILEALGLRREAVVITNALKCHTTNNREPKPAEVDFCRNLWLPRELGYLTNVSILIPLGNPATRAILGKSAVSTGTLQFFWATVKFGDRTFTVYPLAHPAYIVRSSAHRDRLYNQVLPQLKTALQRQHGEAYQRAERPDGH